MRKTFVVFVTLTLLLAATPFAATKEPAMTAAQALARLKRGNVRAAHGASIHPHQNGPRRRELASGQQPFAIIVACSDSRVPPELVFDQGLGDLFVIRVAGNVVDDTALGSIEYAVEHLGAKLIVVLGHERCGAVKAAVDGGEAPAHIGSLVRAIAPAVVETANMKGDRLDLAVRANVRRVVRQLSDSEPLLHEAVQKKAIEVVGMEYDLDTGSVESIP
jgi:carbonic anhydrase